MTTTNRASHHSTWLARTAAFTTMALLVGCGSNEDVGDQGSSSGGTEHLTITGTDGPGRPCCGTDQDPLDTTMTKHRVYSDGIADVGALTYSPATTSRPTLNQAASFTIASPTAGSCPITLDNFLFLLHAPGYTNDANFKLEVLGLTPGSQEERDCQSFGSAMATEGFVVTFRDVPDVLTGRPWSEIELRIEPQ